MPNWTSLNILNRAVTILTYIAKNGSGKCLCAIMTLISMLKLKKEKKKFAFSVTKFNGLDSGFGKVFGLELFC